MNKQSYTIYVDTEHINSFNSIVENNFNADSVAVTYKGIFWSEYEAIISEEELLLLTLTIEELDIRPTDIGDYDE